MTFWFSLNSIKLTTFLKNASVKALSYMTEKENTSVQTTQESYCTTLKNQCTCFVMTGTNSTPNNKETKAIKLVKL